MRLLKWLMGSTAGLMLISCVTINIYFPAAAAEKAADRIIEDVWSRDEAPAQPATPDETSQLNQNLPIAMQVLNWLVSPAQAEANLNINSPSINALQAKMKQRHERLHPYYQTGAVGLTSDGLITLREASAVPLKDRNTVNTLIAEENQDRKALYAEIARANGHPEWESDIQETFARRWISNAAKGWWYQQGGSWQQK
ncbi:YdbL family protein [Methylophaga pinxianii]|uniref:YdbL family protein n=1 Tax=Methylophaga pinxianii TaxID=2881052 RepID=UPI001CF1F8F9|nr:YdbL family protein [Methylophaga pinxianii]MCB2426149.1 YdbL family protein [Methylophaga pinxianii]UPH45141.1 YdbL family protein [Methylophaga pinxianii]